MEREALTFIRQYQADRPLLQKVFDPHANDLGTYQARELSYALDLLDANAFSQLASILGSGFSIPATALATSLLLVLIFLVGASRTTDHLGRTTTALLLLCFLSSFGFVSTMGVFYRSAKPVLAAVVLAWLFHVRAVQRKRTRFLDAGRSELITRDAAVTFALAVTAGLLDRQGLFCVLAASVILGVHYRWTRQLLDLLVATVTAVVVLQLYNFAIGPLTINALNGYWPDFSYQAIPLREVLRLPNHMVRAIDLLLQNTALMLGGFQLVAIALVVLVAAVAWRRRAEWSRGLRSRSEVMAYLRYDPRGRVLAYCLLVFASQVVMFALMIARHGYVYRWIDHRFWYYPLPYLAVALFGMLLAADFAMRHVQGRYRRALPLLLVALTVSNCLSLDRYREIMVNGPWFGPIYIQCEALKASFRSGSPDPQLDPAYRAFFEHRHQLRVSSHSDERSD